VRLRRCKTSKVSGGPTTEAETAIDDDDDEAVGFIDKPGAWNIDLDILQEQGKPEIDYVALMLSKELITVTREVVGGLRYQFLRARVASADEDGADDGKNTMSVKIIALKRKRL
jgi:hypothetical protein